jgi:hypothetical protein
MSSGEWVAGLLEATEMQIHSTEKQKQNKFFVGVFPLTKIIFWHKFRFRHWSHKHAGQRKKERQAGNWILRPELGLRELMYREKRC